MINIIAAVSTNGVIGRDGDIPWNYPEDMKFFRQKTTNGAVIMGRKTWESIGKPLPNRKNIVVTSSKIDYEGVPIYTHSTFSNLKDAIHDVQGTYRDIWLIGGASIYREGMEYADRIYLTLIPEKIEGNNLVYFPWINPIKFEKITDIQLDENLYNVCYERYKELT